MKYPVRFPTIMPPIFDRGRKTPEESSSELGLRGRANWKCVGGRNPVNGFQKKCYEASC